MRGKHAIQCHLLPTQKIGTIHRVLYISYSSHQQMAEDYPPVAYFYEENGKSVLGITDEWWAQSKDEYMSFDSFKKYFRRKEISERLVNFDKDTGMAELIENPPKMWVESDSGLLEETMPGVICRFVSNKVLKSLAQREYNSIENLIEQGYFKTAVIRESAFFEEFLVLMCVRRLRDNKLETLSNKDLNLVEQIGHSDRIRLARLLRILDEKQHGYLQEMAFRRNEIAHTPWREFNQSAEDDIQRVVVKANSVLSQLSDSMPTKRFFE